MTASVEVRLPAVLRAYAGGAASVTADGVSVAAVLDDLRGPHPTLVEHLLDDSGLRRYLNVYVGGRDVRLADGLATAVTDGDVVTILPAGAPEPDTRHVRDGEQ